MRPLLLLLALLGMACGGEELPAPPPQPQVEAPRPAQAPVEPARLEVEVRDARNQLLPGAELTLTEVFAGTVLRALADENGVARWEQVAPGNHELALVNTVQQQQQLQQASGASQSLWQHIAPRKSIELESGMRLRVVLGGTSWEATRVHGRLTRRGQPAAGVLIVAQNLQGEQREFARAMSEGDGRFELRLLPGLYDFTLQHSLGGASITRRMRIAEAGEQAVDFELAGGLLRGRLLDRKGNAIEGRRIELKLLETGGLPVADAVQPSMISGEDGAFLFRDLPAGNYRLSAGENAGETDPEAPGFARILTRELRLPLPEDMPLDLVLEPGWSLRGMLDGGDTGARVFVHDARGEVVAMVVCERDPRRPAGKVEFRVDDLPAGPLRVRAEYRTLASALSAPVRLDGTEPALVDLKLEPSEMLRVDIGTDGALPRVVQVSLRNADDSRVEHRELRTIGNDAGSLRAYFNGLLPGRWTLNARDEQGRRAAVDHESTRPGSQIIRLELR